LKVQVHPAHQAVMAFNDPQVAEVGSVDSHENWKWTRQASVRNSVCEQDALINR
jgi:hypothetical protein